MYPDPSPMMKHDDFVNDCNRLCAGFYGVKDKSLCTEDAWEPDWEGYVKRCCYDYALCKVETVWSTRTALFATRFLFFMHALR